jgi:hypothetical protein
VQNKPRKHWNPPEKQGKSAQEGEKIMRTITIAAMFVVVVGTSCVSAQWGPQGRTSNSATAATRPGVLSLTPIYASDGTFSVEMPAGWQLRSAQLRGTFAQSTRRESVAWGTVNAIDIPHFRAYQRILGQFAGYASQVFPVVANPIPPAEVVRQLYPRFNRAVQDLRVLGEQRTGPSSSLVIYRYTLRAPASAVMRGAAVIFTTQSRPDNFGIWTIAYWKAEAPEYLFHQDMPLFEKVFSSLRYDTNRILALVAQNESNQNGTVNTMINQERDGFQRRSQMISQFGQFMQNSQVALGNAFSQGNLERNENEIATLAEQEIKVDAQGNKDQVGIGADCVNNLTQHYGYSNGQGCAALGPNWNQVTSPPVR